MAGGIGNWIKINMFVYDGGYSCVHKWTGFISLSHRINTFFVRFVQVTFWGVECDDLDPTLRVSRFSPVAEDVLCRENTSLIMDPPTIENPTIYFDVHRTSNKPR